MSKLYCILVGGLFEGFGQRGSFQASLTGEHLEEDSCVERRNCKSFNPISIKLAQGIYVIQQTPSASEVSSVRISPTLTQTSIASEYPPSHPHHPSSQAPT